MNSDLIRNLCPAAAPELAKATWIQPGRSSWQWWSSGDPNYAEQHQWVDWTKQARLRVLPRGRWLEAVEGRWQG